MTITEIRIEEIHSAVTGKSLPKNKRLLDAAKRVVEARHYMGDDGWDRLKNAIAELEGELEKL